ncbi:hypothetical protein AB4865_10945 [Capnocytophaga sp. ARDL2]|uniref:hypothetical protein n=1 Tax=Capnocytophaga sp. ARDL2 TaxID=3238809 RepID=UPI003557B33E
MKHYEVISEHTCKIRYRSYVYAESEDEAKHKVQNNYEEIGMYYIDEQTDKVKVEKVEEI